MEEKKELDQAIAGKYVRILRHWSDKDDRIKPEIYVVTGFLPGGSQFIFTNLLTGAEVTIPQHRSAGDPRRLDIYLVMTPEETRDYLLECIERAVRDNEFVTKLSTDIIAKSSQCRDALKRMYGV